MLTQIQIFMLQCPFGFVTERDMAKVIKLAPRVPMLLRCGRERYLVPANQVAATIAAVVAGGDYLRDVSFPAHLMDVAREARKEARQQVKRLVADVTAAVNVNNGPTEPLNASQRAALAARIGNGYRGEEEYRGDHDSGL